MSLARFHHLSAVCLTGFGKLPKTEANKKVTPKSLFSHKQSWTPLATGMSTDNNSHLDIVQELNVWRRCKTSRVNLSSEDIISWHTSRPEEGFYTLNPPINFCIVQWQQILLPFFPFQRSIWYHFFNISMTRIHKTSLFFFHIKS